MFLAALVHPNSEDAPVLSLLIVRSLEQFVSCSLLERPTSVFGADLRTRSIAAPRAVLRASPHQSRFVMKQLVHFVIAVNVCNEKLPTTLIDYHHTRDTLPRAQSTEGERR